MSVYIFALGIKAANGLVKSTINTANAFADEGTEVSIINILGNNGGFDFLDPAFELSDRVNRYSLDALSDTYSSELKAEEFYTENQQFLKASYHMGHRKVLEVLNEQLTENDLVIFTHPLAMILFAKANPQTKAKTVIQVHGNYLEEVDNMALLKDYVNAVDYIQTVSQYMRDDLIEALDLNAEKVICIHNITRPIKLHKQQDSLKRISIIGSIQKRKNQLDAVKMLSLIEDRNVVLQIYGKALKKEYLDQIHFYIENHNLKDRVIFKDVCSEREIYENTDIVIMTSEHEGYPYIFFESAVYNIPIISYDFKYGAKEFTCDNQNGCLIPMFDYTQLANRVSELLNDADKYREVIEFNRQNFENRYSEKSILQAYHALFENRNQRVNFAEDTHLNQLRISDLECTDSTIHLYQPWNDAEKAVPSFKVSFKANIELDESMFYYVYKKSKFPIKAEKQENILFSKFAIGREDIVLQIPQVNRISLDKPMQNFSLNMQYNSKEYTLANIVKGQITPPPLLKL